MEATATLPGQTPLQIGADDAANMPAASAGAPPAITQASTAGSAFPTVSGFGEFGIFDDRPGQTSSCL